MFSHEERECFWRTTGIAQMQDRGWADCLMKDDDLSAAVNRLPGGLCPYITQPFNDCYCYRITSHMIVTALRFCGGAYRQCTIWQRHQKAPEEETSDQPAGCGTLFNTEKLQGMRRAFEETAQFRLRRSECITKYPCFVR